MFPSKASKLAFALSVALSMAAPVAAEMTRPVTLRFAPQVNGEPFVCGQRYEGVGSAKTTVTATDLRFYVSEVALLTADGGAVPVALDQDDKWQYRDAALLDFEDGQGACRNGTPGKRDAVSGQIPAGDYRGVRFTLGLPPALNHADVTQAPSPLNLTAMFWSWQAGYRFLKLELTSRSAPDARPHGFSVHIGSTECRSDSVTQPATSCGRPNRVVVTLPEFDPQRDLVGVDLAALLAQTRLDANTPGTAPGCMAGADDPDCVGIFAALGLSAGSSQRVFGRVRP